MKKKTQKTTEFKAEHIRILRESLVWSHSKAPAYVKKKIINDLLRFADSIKELCQCEDKAFLEQEKKYACLNCGRRHKSEEGDPRLERVK